MMNYHYEGTDTELHLVKPLIAPVHFKLCPSFYGKLLRKLRLSNPREITDSYPL